MDMSYLSRVEAKLPPGFRFHPRDEELVCGYLAKKVSGDSGNGNLYNSCPLIVDVDLNKCEPWELPEVACVGGKEWYFFSLRDRKYTTGQRTNRATQSGYWKATGKDRAVSRRGVLVGMRKTLVFYKGRAPKGRKTDWVMHEFRMERNIDPSKFFKEDWVLCRVLYKARGVAPKSSLDACFDDTGSSSLPPLMDTYITFKQAPQATPPPPPPPQPSSSLQGYEQVPCFSTFPMLRGSSGSSAASAAVLLPFPGSSEKDVVIKAILNHFNKVEGISSPLVKRELPPTMAEGSLESYSYMNEAAGVSDTWNPF